MRYRPGQRLFETATRTEYNYEGPVLESGIKEDQRLTALDGTVIYVTSTLLFDRSRFVPLPPYLPVATPAIFERYSLMEEVATQKTFIIVGLPHENRDSETLEPCYSIQGPDVVRWNVPQKKFEDGSFVVKHDFRPTERYRPPD